MISPWVERLYDVRFGYFVKRFRFPPISIDLGARNSLWDSFVLGFRFVSFRVVWHTRFKVQLLHTWNHTIFSSPTKCLRLIRYCNSSMNYDASPSGFRCNGILLIFDIFFMSKIYIVAFSICRRVYSIDFGIDFEGRKQRWDERTNLFASNSFFSEKKARYNFYCINTTGCSIRFIKYRIDRTNPACFIFSHLRFFFSRQSNTLTSSISLINIDRYTYLCLLRLLSEIIVKMCITNFSIFFIFSSFSLSLCREFIFAMNLFSTIEAIKFVFKKILRILLINMEGKEKHW